MGEPATAREIGGEVRGAAFNSSISSSVDGLGAAIALAGAVLAWGLYLVRRRS